MHRITTAVLIILLAGCASLSYTPPKERDIQKATTIRDNYNNIWRRTVSWFARNNIVIDKIEKESGLITAKYKIEMNSAFLDCGSATTTGTLTADAEQVMANLNVVLIPESSSYTNVTMNIFGEFSLQNRDAWDGSPVRFDGRCVSTGVLEKVFFSEIRA